MELVRGKTFEQTRVPIDGVRFEDCTFKQTKLIFRAEGSVEFDRCTFDACEWVFEEAALSTLRFLSALYDGLDDKGHDLVGDVFEAVREGRLGAKLFQPEAVSAA